MCAVACMHVCMHCMDGHTCRQQHALCRVAPDRAASAHESPVPAPLHALPSLHMQFGTQSGSERNSRALQELLGWRGLLMDGKYHKPAINLHKEFVTPVRGPLMKARGMPCTGYGCGCSCLKLLPAPCPPACMHAPATCLPACLPAHGASANSPHRLPLPAGEHQPAV